MNQPDQANNQHDPNLVTAIDNQEEGLMAQENAEWLPEDDDDWYEPECCRGDQKGS